MLEKLERAAVSTQMASSPARVTRSGGGLSPRRLPRCSIRPLALRLPSTLSREFGLSYGERGMAKIMVALGLEWARNINAWRLPR